MAIYESGEDYLETILILQRRTGYVRSVDIANELGYSKPSISRAVLILKNNGYITVEPSGQILLTELGMQKASGIYDRHLIIHEFFEQVLGIDSETADSDACKIEHVISEESYRRLKDFVISQRPDND
ncbi:MAG: metal-dependent transcriptional regulator [Oscillospiraceae bacterium]|nr:metal-dependent transcriptional regulator [Oscillospiraceae bacterium]